jgi:hypothetical protein
MAGLENGRQKQKGVRTGPTFQPERGDAIVLLAPIVVDGAKH